MAKINPAQAASLLGHVLNNMKGMGATADLNVDTTNFASVATTVARFDMSDIALGILNELGKLKFTARPYNAQFDLPVVPAEEFAMHRQRVSTLTGYALPMDDPSVAVAENQTFGTHTIRLPKHIHTHFYGDNNKQVAITISIERLSDSFASLASFTAYMNEMLTDVENSLVMQREALSRATLSNFILGKYAMEGNSASNGTHVIHLLTEYNNKFGHEYDSIGDLMKVEADYKQFARYVRVRLSNLVKEFANNDNRYHVNPLTATPYGGTILRHTPKESLRIMAIDEVLTDLEAFGLFDVRNLGMIPETQLQRVGFWMLPDEKTTVTGKCTYMKTDGTVADTTAIATKTNVFAVLFDENAIQASITRQSTNQTPVDAEKLVANRYYHMNYTTDQDFTEKAVVLDLN